MYLGEKILKLHSDCDTCHESNSVTCRSTTLKLLKIEAILRHLGDTHHKQHLEDLEARRSTEALQDSSPKSSEELPSQTIKDEEHEEQRISNKLIVKDSL